MAGGKQRGERADSLPVGQPGVIDGGSDARRPSELEHDSRQSVGVDRRRERAAGGQAHPREIKRDV